MNNTERLKAFLDSEGFNSELYCEMLNRIDSKCDLFYLTSNDFHIANDLFEWGFVSKTIKPIIDKNGCYHGNKIYFFSNNYKIEIKNNT